ncbi:MAG: hypothetical protein H7Y04_10420, partial [Verrucomicrobia bacterium]|nr:hypothetical protein [Cytophagales bacterium]
MKNIFNFFFITGIILLSVNGNAQNPDQNHKKGKIRIFTREFSRAIDKTFDALDTTLSLAFKNFNLSKSFDEDFRDFDERFGKNFDEFGKKVDKAFQNLDRRLGKDAVCDTTCQDWDGDDDQNFDAEKRKKISRNFKVNVSDKLQISNQFGKVHINTWDKNEMQVDVEVIAKAGSEAKAQEILDKINIEISQNQGLIVFKTVQESINSRGNDRKSFEINYVAYMPRNNPLTLRNSFGDTYIANLNGRADITSSHGSLRTEKLMNNDNDVDISFGNGSILYVKGGKLAIAHSDFTLGNAEN